MVTGAKISDFVFVVFFFLLSLLKSSLNLLFHSVILIRTSGSTALGTIGKVLRLTLYAMF